MSPKTGTSTVSCPCGASLKVDSDDGSTDAVCPECGMMLEVVVSQDSSGAKRLGILVKSASVAPRQGKSKTKGSWSDEVHTAKCTCGALLTIAFKSAAEIYVCEACQAEYTATLKHPRGGGVPTLVLRPLLAMPIDKTAPKTTRKAPPVKAAPAPAPPPPPKPAPAKAAPKPAKAASAPPAGGNLAAKENMLMMTKSDIGAQEIVAGGVVSTIQCFCGQPLTLEGDYHRELHKCADCGSSFRIFAAKNPKTRATMAIMIPR